MATENKEQRHLRNFIKKSNLTIVSEDSHANGWKVRVRAPNGQEQQMILHTHSSDRRSKKNDEADIRRFALSNCIVKNEATALQKMVSSPVAAPRKTLSVSPKPTLSTPPQQPETAAAPMNTPANSEATVSSTDTPESTTAAAPRRSASRRTPNPVRKVVSHHEFYQLCKLVEELSEEERETSLSRLTNTLSEVLGREVSESTIVSALEVTGVVLAPPTVPADAVGRMQMLADALERVHSEHHIPLTPELKELIAAVR